MVLTIQVLAKKHERSSFNCGHELLDSYIKRQASQDVNRDLSACFVLVNEQNIVKGYYTLSANAIPRADFPLELQKKMPPGYGNLPTALLGRLAVDDSAKGQGYGAILLVDALNRALNASESIGTLAIIVDPIDDQARSFYRKFGFILLTDTGKMFLPMRTIRNLFP